MAITSWSFSKLQDFEKCKFLCYLKHDAKVPEPERALRPGQTEHPNDRGSRVHDAAEHFVDGTGPLIPELRKFELEFNKLRSLYDKQVVELEGEWGMDDGWEIAPWRTAWLRLKLDALVHTGPYSAVVIDYKTGKKFGNEVKHAQQLQLYALVTFLRYPYLEEVTAELWYTDVDDITTQTFTRDQSLRFKQSFDKRGRALTTATAWPPNANKFTCQWCLYGPEHSGHCSVGVRKAT
jgi:RecB family exonuclease